MDSRNWRGIVISVITSAVLVVGNTGMAFADAEQYNTFNCNNRCR